VMLLVRDRPGRGAGDQPPVRALVATPGRGVQVIALPPDTLARLEREVTQRCSQADADEFACGQW
jgi:hypothetical protein